MFEHDHCSFSSICDFESASFSLLIFKALDRGAAMLKVDKVATGHNADDIAETVLLNILRGDIARYASVIPILYFSSFVCMNNCLLFVDWVDALR